MDAGEVRYRITADASGATSNVQNFEAENTGYRGYHTGHKQAGTGQ